MLIDVAVGSATSMHPVTVSPALIVISFTERVLMNFLSISLNFNELYITFPIFVNTVFMPVESTIGKVYRSLKSRL